MNLDIAIRYKSASFSLSAAMDLFGNVLQHYVNCNVSEEGEGVGGK